MNRSLPLGALAFAVSSFGLASAPASVLAGEPTAVEILKMVDVAGSNFKDLTTDSKMVVKEPGAANGREYRFLTISRGSEKRIVRFLEPGDVKGMGMLVEGRDTMYAYLPGFERVRRLGTHVKNQSFMGSDASFEDMAAGNLADLYDAKVISAEGGEWVIELTIKAGKDSEFAKRKLWVDKGHHQATKIEDYDAKGTCVRTQTRTDFRKDEGPGEHFTPFKLVIVDHRRNEHSTEILMMSAKVNQNVPDDTFSQRALVRGR
mgnify:FL=1